MFNILAATALSAPASFITKVIMLITTQTPVGVPVDVELDMIAQGVPFEIVEEMPDRFNLKTGSFAYYSGIDDMIYFVSESGYFSYGEFLVGATHEMVHYYRDQSGRWSEDQWMEEAVACYGPSELDNDMGMDTVDISRKECDRWFLDSQKANNIENPHLPSKEEMDRIERNVESLRKYILS